jgi:hypothetical protein
MRKLVFATAAVLLVLVAGSAAWLQWRMAQPLQLTLRFHPVVGGEPLRFNEARYPNPGGAGRFAVRDFQFFLSNIRLRGARDSYVEPDSYHLVRFDDGTGAFDIALGAVPRDDYDLIEFGLGVDPAANGTIDQRGDLDPNGRMAWTWDVGYKFVLFEGALEIDDRRQPLVYHVGFDENYRPLGFALDPKRLTTRAARLDFRVDLLQMFGGSNPVDMAQLPTVKFDHTDAARLAGNYSGMITPSPSGRAGGGTAGLLRTTDKGLQ